MTDAFWETAEITLVEVGATVETVIDTIVLDNQTVDVTVDAAPTHVIVESHPVVGTVIPPKQVITDLVSSVEAYVGYALPGRGTGDSGWQICRTVDTPDGPRTTWAHNSFGSYLDLNWDDRLTYVYG